MYLTISLLSCREKVIKIVAEQLSRNADRIALPSKGRIGSGMGRSAIDPAVIMVDRVHMAWGEDDITGFLHVDIKAQFPSMARERLIDARKAKRIDGELI